LNLRAALADWMGIAPAASVAEPAKPDPIESGASGTPIFGGFLRELGEYNSTFSGGPFSAYLTYEQMRRGDAQVAATLAAIKLPIRSAGWTIREPEDATPVEIEATEHARECFLEELDIDAVIRNALLMLDFGVSVHEDCWYVDGNRIRMKKLAPRLPLTFFRWLCTEDGGDLGALDQMGYKGGQYVHVQTPSNKLAVFTYEQEGLNFAGRSLLRAMYQHWYIKSNLYKVDAIACERNGMGVPYAIMGPDAKAEDRKTAIAWLSALSAHEKAAILLPPEWQFGLKGVEGTVRDIQPSILHHNLQISMAGLAMFMNLGQTDKGARSLGETLADFFQMSVQATANQIGRTISLTSMKRLIDFNFEGVKNYPRLIPTEIGQVKFESVVAALKDLAGAHIIEPDDDIEAWMRKKMGAPDKGEPRKAPPPPAPFAQNNPQFPQPDATTAPAGRPEPQSPAGRKSAASAPAKKVAASEAITVDGVRLSRPPKPQESVLALAEIVGELDRGRDAIATALRAARPRVQKEIVQKLMSSTVRNMHRVSVAPDADLVAEVQRTLAQVCDFGRGQVAAERVRALKGKPLPEAAQIRAAERDPLGVYADGVVGEFTNNLTARAANVALDYTRRPQGTKGQQILGIEQELDGQSDKWIDGVAAKGTNEAFADGRQDGYEQHKDEISQVICSALLDINTCESCAAADGQEGATPDDIPDVPNPDCDGGDKCRCVHVYVFSDEEGQ
jgi:hypothetical protein